jgi:hypothetical protein
MSFGLLTLAPLLGLGMKTARFAAADSGSALIARTLVQEARQGTLGTAPQYFDDQGAVCNPLDAAFMVQPVTQVIGNSASRLTLRVTPLGAPGRMRVYAVVLPAGAQN